MGAHICQYGVTHKVCRCLKEHRIQCDKPEEHKDAQYVPKHKKD